MPTKRSNISSLTRQYLTAKRPFLKESSYAHYVELAENYIEPYVGKLKFEELNSDTAVKYVSQLKIRGRTSRKGGLSDKTIRDVCSLLKSVYNLAAENGKCPSDIRFPRITISKPSRMKSQILTLEHQKQLVNNTQ